MYFIICIYLWGVWFAVYSVFVLVVLFNILSNRINNEHKGMLGLRLMDKFGFSNNEDGWTSIIALFTYGLGAVIFWPAFPVLVAIVGWICCVRAYQRRGGDIMYRNIEGIETLYIYKSSRDNKQKEMLAVSVKDVIEKVFGRSNSADFEYDTYCIPFGVRYSNSRETVWIAVKEQEEAYIDWMKSYTGATSPTCI